MFTIGMLLVTMPILYPLNIFSEKIDMPAIYTIVDMCISGAAFIIGIVASWALIGNKSISKMQQKTAGGLFIMFALIELYITVVRAFNLGLIYDFGLYERSGCRDISLTGNPIARYEESTNITIKLKSECTFNAFVTSNINGGTLIDWSNYLTYDANNRNVLLAAANSAGADFGLDDIPYYHKSWYWGCSEICHDRYAINMIWITTSASLILTHSLIAVLYFCTPGNDYTLVSGESSGTSSNSKNFNFLL